MKSIDDTLLSAYGVTLKGYPPRGGGETSIIVPLARAAGGVRIGGSEGSRELRADGHMVAATPAELQSNIAALTALLQGDRAYQIGRFPDREWVGRFQARDDAIKEVGPPDIATAALLNLEVALPMPHAIARAETISPVVGGTAPLVLGDAPTPLRVDVRNVGNTAITQIVVTVATLTGAVLRSLSWVSASGVLPGKVWSVSDESHAITNDGVSAMGGLAAGYEYPWAVASEGAGYVFVTTSAGSTAAAVVRYFRRWR